MAPQDSFQAEAYASTPLPEPAPIAAYELRPLTLGEVLDRTFSVYKSRFWLFAGIGSLAAGLQTLLGALQLIPMHMTGPHVGVQPDVFAPGAMSPAMVAGLAGGALIGFIVFGFLYMFVFIMTQAATVFAVSEVYLGKPVTIAESVRATIGKWYRQVGIGIWQSFSMAWIPMALVIAGVVALAASSGSLKVVGVTLLFLAIFGGLPAGFVLWLRNSLGVQTAVIEGLTVRAAMKRSKVLTSGAKWRIFVVLILCVVLSYVAALLQMPLMMIVMFALAKGGQAIGSEIAMLLVGFVGHAVVSPVMMIGLSLIYFDQRVRKEALDLVMLMGGAVATPAADWGQASQPVQVAPPQPPPFANTVTEPEPAAQQVVQSPEEDAGHAGDVPVV